MSRCLHKQNVGGESRHLKMYYLFILLFTLRGRILFEQRQEEEFDLFLLSA